MMLYKPTRPTKIFDIFLFVKDPFINFQDFGFTTIAIIDWLEKVLNGGTSCDACYKIAIKESHY